MSTAKELQAQIDKMAIELEALRKQVSQQRTQEFANRVSDAEEQFIAKRAKAYGIDMSAPLPDDTDYEKELIKRVQDINDQAYYTHFSNELKKDLESEGKKGGKNKRKSQRQKNKQKRQRKSHHKSQRSKH